MFENRHKCAHYVHIARGCLLYCVVYYMHMSEQKTVTIYSTPSCHFCNLAKSFFKEHNVAYVEYDVAADIEKRKEMVTLTGQLGVPVIRIGDQVTIGFQAGQVAEMLGIAA